MELHPLTSEVMARLKYDHVVDYLYILKDDLEIIVSHKLHRPRKSEKRFSGWGVDPIEDVRKIVQGMLDYLPKQPISKCTCGIEFRGVSDLIRDTAVHFLKERYAKSRKENM